MKNTVGPKRKTLVKRFLHKLPAADALKINGSKNIRKLTEQ